MKNKHKFLWLFLLISLLASFSSIVFANNQFAVGSYFPQQKGSLLPTKSFILTSNNSGQSWTHAEFFKPFEEIYKDLMIRSIKCLGKTCIAFADYQDSFKKTQPLFFISDDGQAWSSVKRISGIPFYAHKITTTDINCSNNTCIVTGWFKSKSISVDTVNDNTNIFFLVSQDKGRSWSFIEKKVGFKEYFGAIKIHCTNNLCIAAGGYQSSIKSGPLLYLSYDHGQTWSTNNDVDQESDLTFFSANSSSNNAIILLGSAKHNSSLVLRLSHDNGLSWSTVNQIEGLPTQLADLRFSYSSLACTGNTCIVAGSYFDINKRQWRSLLLNSEDGGLSWKNVNNIANFPAGKNQLRKVNCFDNVCFALGKADNDRALVLRKDSENHWTNLDLSAVMTRFNKPYESLHAIHCEAQTCIVVGGAGDKEQSVFKPLILWSNDFGQSWLQVKDAALPVDLEIGALYSLANRSF